MYSSVMDTLFGTYGPTSAPQFNVFLDFDAFLRSLGI